MAKTLAPLCCAINLFEKWELYDAKIAATHQRGKKRENCIVHVYYMVWKIQGLLPIVLYIYLNIFTINYYSCWKFYFKCTNCLALRKNMINSIKCFLSSLPTALKAVINKSVLQLGPTHFMGHDIEICTSSGKILLSHMKTLH